MDDRCEKFDLPKDQCAHCRPPTARPTAGVVRLPFRSRTFTASYYSPCGSCDMKIEPGDAVLYEDAELVHEDCQTEIITSDGPPKWSDLL